MQTVEAPLRPVTRLPDFPKPEAVDLSGLAVGILGYKAIYLCQQRANLTSKASQNETRGPTFALSTRPSADFTPIKTSLIETNEGSLDAEIREIRERVGALSKTDRDRFNIATSINVQAELDSPEERFNRLKSEGLVTDDWAGWIFGEASEGELLGFLARDAMRIYAKQNSDWYQREVEEVKADYSKGIKEGIRLGPIHEEAEEALANLGGTALIMTDFMDTRARGRSGYAVHGSRRAHIAELVGHGFGYLDAKTARHEINHALLGSYGPEIIYTDEALAEHTALATIDGQWWDIDPAKHGYGSYLGCRSLQAAIILRDQTTSSLYTRAYSARSEEARAEAVMAILASQSQETMGILDKLYHVFLSVRKEAEKRGDSKFAATDDASQKLIVMTKKGPELDSVLVSGSLEDALDLVKPMENVII